MRILLTCVAVASIFAVVGGCKKQDDSSSPNTAPSAAYSAYTPAPTYAQPYPTVQQAYPAAAPTAPPMATAPAPVGAPVAMPAGSAMATPGPLAFQCTNDVPCGTHHCNTQYGKCAFPCQSSVDCITPNSCLMGLCVPAPVQAH